MARPDKLSDAQIDTQLSELPGWQRDGDSLRREFEFEGFAAAFGFMAAAATEAAALDHHPDWSNVYNRVQVTLSTHDVGGITELDVELARRMSSLAS